MKKITRIAALLAAGALLFGAFGCSSGGDGDGDETPSGTTPVSYTLKAGTPNFDSGSLKVSGMDTTEDTGDDTFEMTLKPTGKAAVTVTGTWELTTENSFVCKPTEDVEINGINVTKATGATGTLNDDDSITLTVEGVSLVFVKNEDSGGITPVEKSFTVDFVGLKSNDFDPAVTFSSEKQDLPASSETKVKNVTLYSRSAGSLAVRNKDGECTGINYGGSSFNNDDGSRSLGATADTSLYARVIYVPVECAGTLKVTYKTTFKPDPGFESLEDKGQIGAYDADGKLIGEVASVAGVNSDKPLTVNVSAATTVAILYARNGTKKNATAVSGGIDVTKIEFTVAESDGNNPNPDGDGEGDKSDDNEGEEPGDPTNPSNPTDPSDPTNPSNPDDENDGDQTTEQTATITYTAVDGNSVFALKTGSEEDIFSTVGTTFTKAGLGTFGGETGSDDAEFALKDGYPKVEPTSFTPSSTANVKVKDILEGGKATFTGYMLNSELKDNTTKIALTKDEDNAFVEYSFTLSVAADVEVSVTAFNSQTGNLYGKVSVLDSDNTEKATSGAKTSGSKEDNDASVTATALGAGTYTVRFAWCPIKDYQASGGIKAFNGGIQSVSIKATATE